MVTTIHLTRDQAPGIGRPVNEDSTMSPESIHSSSLALDDKVLYRTSFPNKNDVLCGRGGIINSHPGNEQYRSMVDSKKRVYVTARIKTEKRLIATSIVEQIRSMDPPGRFLQKDMNSKTWVDIGVEKSREKTSQALRENTKDARTLKPGTGTRKCQWSEEEDTFVLKVIAVSPKQPFTQWTDLAALLPGKSGKQIRDRWINYLNPSINHLPFSQEDDLKLWHGHAELGKRWAEISVKIFNSTRSENHIKNRWYSAAFKKFIASEFGDSAYMNASSSVKALSKIKMTADDEEEDYGALIYRESQLRKAEAAAAVAVKNDAENKRKDSSPDVSPTGRLTSSCPGAVRSKESENIAQRKETEKRKREAPSEEEEEEVFQKRAQRKQYKKTCSAYECTNKVVKGGVCRKHGAKVEYTRCSSEGCTNYAVKGGVCVRHGAKVEYKLCSSEGCTNIVKKGGVCIKHGATVKRCSSDGCTNQAREGGVCRKHGAKVKDKLCSIEGCTNQSRKGGVCIKHGAKEKRCSSGGCTNRAVKGGVCIKHGAKLKRCSIEGCKNGGVCFKHGANKELKRWAKKKRCSSEGCKNEAKQGGVCIRHGAKVKRKQCSNEGCTKFVQKGGVCRRHGAEKKRCIIEGCTNKAQQGVVEKKHGTRVKLCSIEMDAQIKLSMEECTLSMRHRRSDAAERVELES